MVDLTEMCISGCTAIVFACSAHSPQTLAVIDKTQTNRALRRQIGGAVNPGGNRLIKASLIHCSKMIISDGPT